MQKPSDLITQLCDGALPDEDHDYLMAVGTMLGYARPEGRADVNWEMAKNLLNMTYFMRWYDIVLSSAHVKPAETSEYLLTIALYLQQEEER